MGLFIDTYKHPDVFMNKEEITEPNQGYFKLDHYSQMVKEQKEINKSLHHSFQFLKSLYQDQKRVQISQWNEIGDQLMGLQEGNLRNETFKTDLLGRLTLLDERDLKLQSMLENDESIKQDINDQITIIIKSNQEIMNELGQVKSLTEQVPLQMNVLHNFQRQMEKHISNQDEVQTHVFDQLKNQEAVMEKISRQLSHFRSILYERTNYLAEKIEDSYNVTSSYVYKMMTGTDQPLTLIYDKHKKGKIPKKVDSED